jgi:hypothetical protein
MRGTYHTAGIDFNCNDMWNTVFCRHGRARAQTLERCHQLPARAHRTMIPCPRLPHSTHRNGSSNNGVSPQPAARAVAKWIELPPWVRRVL